MTELNTLETNHITLREIWLQILERHLNPEDIYEIAAILESMGWSDARVQRQFGKSDVFDLARTLQCLKNDEVGMQSHPADAEAPFWNLILDSLRQFLRGMIFALPMILSIASM